MTTKGENFIHLKFEHDEATDSRRDLLSSELDLVNIMKSLNDYIAFRTLEIKLRAKLFREMKKILTDIKRLESTLPEFELPKIVKHPQKKKEEIKESVEALGVKKDTKKNDSLESQLADIQRKLKNL
jgi:hypothetical protein